MRVTPLSQRTTHHSRGDGLRTTAFRWLNRNGNGGGLRSFLLKYGWVGLWLCRWSFVAEVALCHPTRQQFSNC